MAKEKSALNSILGMRCPRCREGKLFVNPNPYMLKHTLKMPETCPNCQQDFRIEPGFYFGATYVSYGLNIGLLIAVGLGLWLFWEATFWRFTIIWIGLAIALTPLFARLARSIWIHSFVKPEKEKLPE